jgi:hypothetical protein
MFQTMGYGVFFFFAALMICSIVFVFFLLPETKGVPLEAMDRLFDKSAGPPRKAHRFLMLELKADEEAFRHNIEGSNYSVAKEKAEHLEDV